MDNLQCDDRQVQANQFTHEFAIQKKISSGDQSEKVLYRWILYILQFQIN